MSDPGDKIKAAIENHNASIEASRKVAEEIAAEREAAVMAAVDGFTSARPSSPTTNE